MQEIIKEFEKNGFTAEEALRIINLRSAENPFAQTQITDRINGFVKLFSKYKKTKKESIIKLRKTPRFFGYTPEYIERNLKLVSRFFEMDPSACFKLFWNTPNIFTIPLARVKRNIELQANVLGLSMDEWKGIAVRKPSILQKSAHLIESGIQACSKELGIPQEIWIRLALKAPELLSANPNTIVKKVNDLSQIFWTDNSCLLTSFERFPSLLYADPKLMQQKYNFLKKMYEDDLIRVDDGGVKHEAYLQEYLLKKPFVLVYSLEALKLKRLYAKYIIETKGKPQKMALYKTERAILEDLKNAPESFWTEKRKMLFQSRMIHGKSR